MGDADEIVADNDSEHDEILAWMLHCEKWMHQTICCNIAKTRDSAGYHAPLKFSCPECAPTEDYI